MSLFEEEELWDSLIICYRLLQKLPQAQQLVQARLQVPVASLPLALLGPALPCPALPCPALPALLLLCVPWPRTAIQQSLHAPCYNTKQPQSAAL